MIIIKNLEKSYISKNTGNQVVFRDFSITFPSTGFISILGRSGCGKTTLLNMLGAIDSPDKGSVKVFGNLISGNKLNDSSLDNYRKELVGFIFQNYNLISEINVYENLKLTLEIQNAKPTGIDFKIMTVLEKVGMKEYSHRFPNELSGG